MYKAIEFSPDQDIASFSRLLWQRRIAHRVHRFDEAQVLAVPRQEQVLEVQILYRRWSSGEISPTEQDSSDLRGWFDPAEALARLSAAFINAPVSLLLVAACVLVAFLTNLGRDFSAVAPLLYPDFSSGGGIIFLDRVVENFSFNQFLRLFTPMLLHFSLIHIAFNMLWRWELGKRIEAVQASWAMLLLVLVLALVSNTVQYLFGGGNNFGGMSGVVYGLFAYIWMWQLFDPAKRLGLPPALIFFMLLSLVILTMLGLDMIADEAHIGGLLCGVVVGATVATVSRVRRAFRTGRG